MGPKSEGSRVGDWRGAKGAAGDHSTRPLPRRPPGDPSRGLVVLLCLKESGGPHPGSPFQRKEQNRTEQNRTERKTMANPGVETRIRALGASFVVVFLCFPLLAFADCNDRTARDNGAVLLQNENEATIGVARAWCWEARAARASSVPPELAEVGVCPMGYLVLASSFFS